MVDVTPVTSNNNNMSKFQVLLIFAVVFLFSAASGLFKRKYVCKVAIV